MAATGHALQTSGVQYTDRRDFYLKPNKVAELFPSAAPFLTMVSRWNTETGLKDPVFKMFEHRNPWIKQQFKVTTGATCAADNAEDTLAVTGTGGSGLPTALTSAIKNLRVDVHANDNGKPKAGAPKGSLLITTFTSATSIKVKNTGSSAITVANDDWLVVRGNAFGEGTEAPDAWADELRVVYGQCGIMKTSLQITGTLKEAVLRGEKKELLRLRKQKGQEHKMQKERNLLFSNNPVGLNLTNADTFGDGGLTDADGNVVRTPYGALRAILDYGVSDVTDDDQNIFEIDPGTYTYEKFVDDSEKIFRYNVEGTHMMFAGGPMIAYWSKLGGSGGTGLSGKSKWSVNISNEKNDTKLGFRIRELDTPAGVIMLVRTPSFTFDDSFKKYGFLPSKEDISHMIYRTPMFMQNIKQDNAPDLQKDMYFSDEGIGMTMLEKHKVMYLK